MRMRTHVSKENDDFTVSDPPRASEAQHGHVLSQTPTMEPALCLEGLSTVSLVSSTRSWEHPFSQF